MNKMLIAVFDNKESALDGLTALRNLNLLGSITLYSAVIVDMDESGESSVRHTADGGPYGIATGLGVGAMLGLLLGPLGATTGAAVSAAASGAVFGGALGSLSGVLVDLHDARVDADFVEEVKEALGPGKAAVIAEVEEYAVTPVDDRLDECGGLVFRRLRYEAADDHYRREAEAFDAELRQLTAELEEATGDEKEQIQAKISMTQSKLRAINERTRSKRDQIKTEADEKLDALAMQLSEAEERNRARIEARIDEVKADYESRGRKLQDAWQLTQDALA